MNDLAALRHEFERWIVRHQPLPREIKNLWALLRASFAAVEQHDTALARRFLLGDLQAFESAKAARQIAAQPQKDG